VTQRVRPVLAALLLAGGICGCSSAGPLGEYKAARTLHLAPDGRLIVSDLGSGKNDGAVVAVDVASGRRTALMADLPSTHNSGQAHADLAGPSGAAMAADGTVCAAIGDATIRDAGFAVLRCANGLVVDLEAFQARSKLPSNPYDVVSDGGDGWYVSDGAANNVLHVDRAGKVSVVARFPNLAAGGFGDRDGQGVPTGMTLGPDRTLYIQMWPQRPIPTNGSDVTGSTCPRVTAACLAGPGRPCSGTGEEAHALAHPEAPMGDNSESEQIGSGGDLTERIRARVDAAEQLLDESAERVGAAAERVRLAHLQAKQAQRTARLAQEHIVRTRERAARAKDRELAAHLRAEKLHTDAARLQERLGHPDRAARARAQAVRARELYALALVEQAEAAQWVLSPPSDED
jgi:hypothetical protein